jgi:hypothetical protein
VSADDKAAAAWDDYVSQQQEEKIEELEREIDRLKMRILSLEVAGANVVYQATEMWKHGAIREWMNLTKKEEL